MRWAAGVTGHFPGTHSSARTLQLFLCFRITHVQGPGPAQEPRSQLRAVERTVGSIQLGVQAVARICPHEAHRHAALVLGKEADRRQLSFFYTQWPECHPHFCF